MYGSFWFWDITHVLDKPSQGSIASCILLDTQKTWHVIGQNGMSLLPAVCHGCRWKQYERNRFGCGAVQA